MLVLLAFGCLICILFCLIPAGQRNTHIGAIHSLAAALALTSLLALIALWPAVMVGECSLLGYCGITFDDGWVWAWMIMVGFLCCCLFLILVTYVVSGQWEREWCCLNRSHPYRWERKRQDVFRREQQDRLGSLGFTEAECWAVLHNIISVVVALGKSRADDDGGCLEYVDDRIRITMWGWDPACSLGGGRPEHSQCEEDCWHGERVRVVMRGPGIWLEVFRAVNSDLPRVSVFRPGEWIAYLSAELTEMAGERIAARAAAQEVAKTAREEARKSELDSRFAWVEDVGSELVEGGRAR